MNNKRYSASVIYMSVYQAAYRGVWCVTPYIIKNYKTVSKTSIKTYNNQPQYLQVNEVMIITGELKIYGNGCRYKNIEKIGFK